MNEGKEITKWNVDNLPEGVAEKVSCLVDQVLEGTDLGGESCTWAQVAAVNNRAEIVNREILEALVRFANGNEYVVANPEEFPEVGESCDVDAEE